MMGDTFVKKAFPALSIVFCPPFPDCLMTYPVVSCCFCYSDFITFFNYPLTKIVDSVNFYRYIHIVLLLSGKRKGTACAIPCSDIWQASNSPASLGLPLSNHRRVDVDVFLHLKQPYCPMYILSFLFRFVKIFYQPVNSIKLTYNYSIFSTSDSSIYQ